MVPVQVIQGKRVDQVAPSVTRMPRSLEDASFTTPAA
jgi:hypothetical protein